MIYNIQNNNAPRYLCDLIPPTIQRAYLIIVIPETLRVHWGRLLRVYYNH
jgi:hypothetical protein